MKKVWQAVMALLAAAGCGVWLVSSAAAFELDMSGLRDHPVRVGIGVACVAVAVALLLYRLLRKPLDEQKRQRSYGEPVSPAAAVASHRKARRKGKRYGGGFLGSFIPSYKGGKSAAGGASLSRSEPETYRRTKRRSYSKTKPGAPVQSYKGGGSSTGQATVRELLPSSYKEPWGSGKRYGRFRLPALPIPYLGRKNGPPAAVLGDHTPDSHRGKRRIFRAVTFRPMLPASYKGGWARANSPDLGVALPESHRKKRTALRFGGGAGIPLPLSYKGGWNRAGSADVAVASEPERYRSGLRRRYGVKNRPDEIPVYRGRRSVLHAARVALAVPPSYREPWGSGRRYGSWDTPKVLPAYHGGSSGAKRCASVPALPPSYREPWGSKRRYGSGVPLQELPLSYREPWGSERRYGAGDPLERTAQPERPHYYGGSTTTAKEPWVNPETGTLAAPRRSSARQYGNRRYGGKLYGLRVVHYREEEPPDSSTVVHEDEAQPIR